MTPRGVAERDKCRVHLHSFSLKKEAAGLIETLVTIFQTKRLRTLDDITHYLLNLYCG
jgi:hypothetical protein